MAKNLCGKMRPENDPYEVWENRRAGWTWLVLKKWQADDDKPYARWFCKVTSPMTGSWGDLGDGQAGTRQGLPKGLAFSVPCTQDAIKKQLQCIV